MPLALSQRSECVTRSEIRNMSLECDRLGGINLSQGVCDTEVPFSVRNAAKSAIDEGHNSYTAHTGIPALRSAIAKKLDRFYGFEVDADHEVVVSAGSTGAFYSACMALCNSGDEIILFEPFYAYHLSTITATGLTAKYVRMTPPAWTFCEQDLDAVIGPRTRGIMICTPGNPTGKVWNRDEIKMVGDFAARHDLWIFTDEIYEHFVYDGRTHICPATQPGLRDRTILISGFSKTLSITGWRIGYCVADTKWAKAIGYFNDLIYVCAPAPLQVGVAQGIASLEPEYFSRIAVQYQVKRDKICSALLAAGMFPYVPQGAYYVLADLSALPGHNPKERATFLLENAGVGCVPGDAFFHGAGGENLARFCFAKEDGILDEACRRIENFTLAA